MEGPPRLHHLGVVDDLLLIAGGTVILAMIWSDRHKIPSAWPIRRGQCSASCADRLPAATWRPRAYANRCASWLGTAAFAEGSRLISYATDMPSSWSAKACPSTSSNGSSAMPT